MIFDFFKSFARNRRSYERKIEDSTAGYSKPKKGFEYEDLLSKPKKGFEYEDLLSKPKKNFKRRNSLTKIYIQDPSDSTNILVAEEIGYVYGDVKSKYPKKKITTGMQTVPVKDYKSLVPLNTKKQNPPGKNIRRKKVKGGKNDLMKEDIRSLTLKEGPYEKGDNVIYPRKNVPKVKSKSVSFFEDRTGVRNVSSTVSGNVYDQGFIPGRVMPNSGSQASLTVEPFSFQGQRSGYNLPRGSFPPKNLRNIPNLNYLQRNDMYKNHLPPINSSLAPGATRSMFQRIQQARSQPNLNQNPSNPFLPQPGSYPSSPLRASTMPLDTTESNPPSRGKLGWNKVREATRKNRADTILNIPYDDEWMDGGLLGEDQTWSGWRGRTPLRGHPYNSGYRLSPTVHSNILPCRMVLVDQLGAHPRFSFKKIQSVYIGEPILNNESSWPRDAYCQFKITIDSINGYPSPRMESRLLRSITTPESLISLDLIPRIPEEILVRQAAGYRHVWTA